MEQFLLFQLKSAVIFAVMLPIVWLAVQEKKFQMARAILLSAILISCVLPLINIPLFAADYSGQVPGIHFLDEFRVTVNNTLNTVNGFNWFDIVTRVYLSGVIFFTALLLYSFVQIALLIRNNSQTKNGRIKFIALTQKKGTFSFFNYIFISPGQNDPLIIEHEKIHAKQFHSLDILIHSVFSAQQWFSPFAWYGKYLLRDLHEYIADEQISRSSGREAYSECLINSWISLQKGPLINSFNCSTLKKRIAMMKKNKSHYAGWKTWIAFPVAAALTLSLTSVSGEKNTNPAYREIMSSSVHFDQETLAEFNGGQEAMYKFISDNLTYPANAKKAKKEGKVFIGFTVKENGKLTDISVKRGFDAECDAEALRVVKMMPDWVPATKNGKAVSSEYVLPFNFKL